MDLKVITPSEKKMFLIINFIYFGERAQTGEEQRETGTERIRSGLCIDIGEPNVGLKLTKYEIMT